MSRTPARGVRTGRHKRARFQERALGGQGGTCSETSAPKQMATRPDPAEPETGTPARGVKTGRHKKARFQERALGGQGGT